ncbi:MAG TPA: phosphoribosylformylglycinamidine cyclo-ligase [Verrucomicrobiae bacterium]|nr:phosphoribosylformylglycinamidine cyclo-ligase [Verrucomicrobiae bacterium]
MKQKAYAGAGVDIELGNRVKATLPQLLASARRPEVLGKVGGFGGLFALDVKKYRQPVLVSSTDGVGTKLKLAFALDRHDTVGEDLVNHCVDDIAVLGAEPLFFLDYIGTGRLQPHVFTQLISGFARGCARNHCALIGGETAQLPGLYQPGEYDLSGTIVGVVEKSRILDGKTIRRGDAVIGLASSGLHTNGYSLARKIFFDQLKLKPGSRVDGFDGTVGDELLKVHVSYGPLIQKLLHHFNYSKRAGAPGKKSGVVGARAGKSPGAGAGTPSPGGEGRGEGERSSKSAIIKGLAHITGGGFVDNIPRILPKNCDVIIRKGTWNILPVFQIIEAKGGVPEAELYEVFNMGIGMTAIVAGDQTDAVLKFIRAHGQAAWQIGEVVHGKGHARII